MDMEPSSEDTAVNQINEPRVRDDPAKYTG